MFSKPVKKHNTDIRKHKQPINQIINNFKEEIP